MLSRLRTHDQIAWSRASIDGVSVASPRGRSDRSQPNRSRQAREQTGPCRGRSRHSAGDHGTGANRHDSMVFETTLDAIPALPGLDGRPRKRPDKLHADKGYDCRRCRRYLKKRGITARIARKGIESKERLGVIDGLSSAHIPGLPASASFASVSSVDSTFMLRFFHGPPPSPVLASLRTCVSGSK
jgi:hypothetical protein